MTRDQALRRLHQRLLAHRADLWRPVLAELQARRPGIDLLLEFVPGDDPRVLAREAGTLREWVQELAPRQLGSPPG